MWLISNEGLRNIEFPPLMGVTQEYVYYKDEADASPRLVKSRFL